MIAVFTFLSMTYFEFIFGYSLRYGLNFTLFQKLSSFPHQHLLKSGSLPQCLEMLPLSYYCMYLHLFWTSYSVLLFILSVEVPLPHCFILETFNVFYLRGLVFLYSLELHLNQCFTLNIRRKVKFEI